MTKKKNEKKLVVKSIFDVEVSERDVILELDGTVIYEEGFDDPVTLVLRKSNDPLIADSYLKCVEDEKKASDKYVDNDIEKRKAIAKINAEFILNASTGFKNSNMKHELKTISHILDICPVFKFSVSEQLGESDFFVKE